MMAVFGFAQTDVAVFGFAQTASALLRRMWLSSASLRQPVLCSDGCGCLRLRSDSQCFAQTASVLLRQLVIHSGIFNIAFSFFGRLCLFTHVFRVNFADI
jgi:hypothetical protein